MKKHTKKYLLLCSAIMSLGFASLGFGGTATGSVGISAATTNSCTVDASTNVAFGDYDPSLTTPTDGTGAVNVFCTSGATYSIGLGQGNNYIGGTRNMEDVGAAAKYLKYDLYQDSGRVTTWDDSTSQLSGQTGSGTLQTHTIYGRIPARQTVSADDYTDTVAITVTY